MFWCVVNCVLLLKTQLFHMTTTGFEACEEQQFYSGTSVRIIRPQVLMTTAAGRNRDIQGSFKKYKTRKVWLRIQITCEGVHSLFKIGCLGRAGWEALRTNRELKFRDL